MFETINPMFINQGFHFIGHAVTPPRDGHMAFVQSPDGISIELLQKGEALAPTAPWQDMENSGSW